MMLRKFLFPFSVVYDLVTSVRNLLFDRGVFKSIHYKLPVIAIGNLCVGGTGKSPMVEYVIRLLKDDFHIATLSRGYRRKTNGFILAKSSSTSNEIGDEPLQFKHKFPGIQVAVDADRQNGISNLISITNPDVIILDDAFQHRKVTAGYYVLLTKYDSLFTDDFLLPAGNLRESRSGAKRANVIIVTKCPKNLSKFEQTKIKQKLNYNNSIKIYFSFISYADHVVSNSETRLLNSLKDVKFTLVTGIANPVPLVNYLINLNFQFDHIEFKDHHNFSDNELKNLSSKELILTTEKDYMRLKSSLNNVFYLSIITKFVNNEAEFNNEILSYVNR